MSLVTNCFPPNPCLGLASLLKIPQMANLRPTKWYYLLGTIYVLGAAAD